MTWSFDDTLPSVKDQIRVLIGDVDVDDPQLSDESLLFFANGSTDAYSAASNAARALSAKYAREANSKSVGSMSVSYQRSQNYAALADSLQLQAFMPGAVLAPPQVGGISKADKNNQEQTADRVPPTFTRTGLDDPGSSEARRQPTESLVWGP